MTTPTLAGSSSPTPSRPRILFVGGSSSASSRLAAALLRRFAGNHVEVGAVWTHPETEPDPVADQVLAEAGMNPAEHPAGRLSASALRRADRVISLGRSVDVAHLPGPHYEVWDTVELEPVDDHHLGAGQDALRERVQALATDLTAVCTPAPAPSIISRLRGLIGR